MDLAVRRVECKIYENLQNPLSHTLKLKLNADLHMFGVGEMKTIGFNTMTAKVKIRRL
jgi:hypothetical protein